MGVFSINYGRIEARFPNVDLLRCSLRRALNFAEDWLLSVVSSEDWEEVWKDILTTNLSDEERLYEQQQRWGDPDEEGRGSFQLTRNEEVEEQPTSNFNFNPAKPS